MDLKKREFASDFEPIDKSCPCVACSNHSRAYIHSLITQKETVACNLVSLHNVCYMVSGVAATTCRSIIVYQPLEKQKNNVD